MALQRYWAISLPTFGGLGMTAGALQFKQGCTQEGLEGSRRLL